MVATTLLIAGLLAFPQQTIEKIFGVDFSSGEARGNVELSLETIAQNPQDRTSVVFPAPGRSSLTAVFELPAPPTTGVLEIEHLSSSAQAKFGGTTRISVIINGDPLVREWEVGTHVFATDRLVLTKMLRAGENRIEVRFDAGQTTYWLRQLRTRCTFPADTSFEQGVERIDGGDDYAVVVSRKTWNDPEWNEVCASLRLSHEATVFIHDGPVNLVVDELAGLFPRHAAFVARPIEAGREYVIAVHRLTRALDEDPYTDLFWGIVTGYEAADALAIARCREPLLVRRAAAGCGLDLSYFHEGTYYSETRQSLMVVKEPGEEAEEKECAADTTELLVNALNDGRPDFFCTSGHATQHDWQIGYSYRNGQFRCKEGRLYGLDLAGKTHSIDSPNPKIYSSAGNCLMGLIEGPQNMAPAWLHSAGVRQMIGYEVSTWYGFGGHGINDIFIRQQGRFTFAEAFRVNNLALVHRLQTEYPGTAAVEFDRFGIEANPNLPDELAARFGLRERDEVGLLWDRDTVAFYGDPAWEARMERVRDPAWTQTLSEVDGIFTFQVTVMSDGPWKRPPTAFLPRRICNIDILEGAELDPVIADDFVLLPRSGAMVAGEALRIRFRASDL